MKTIQWFPGHMTKAMRMMEQSVPLADGVIYVLDARCPAASFNKKLLSLTGNKPVLYVLNKGDLADGKADAFLKKFGNAVRINAVNSSSRKTILSAIDKLTAEKRERANAKGYSKIFRFMVVGVPNTGKSTVINLLAGSKRTVTGDKAGVTRGKQWIRLDGFELLDTPGTMPPAFENQKLALHLAFVGSINDDILDLDDIALALLEELYKKYPARLEERYGITGGTPLEMLEKVCARRGLILRGGEYDYERGERAVIDDFRKGRLGAVTLDTVEDLNGLI
ncbi:MAG: ribosome biogenesis GTPase YlqF [Clostridia bacterium]|nr:ribosome biogenesis GTPase YlqF [Clostridia bacterium]